MLAEELETIKKVMGVRGSVPHVRKWSRKESSRSFCSHARYWTAGSACLDKVWGWDVLYVGA